MTIPDPFYYDRNVTLYNGDCRELLAACAKSTARPVAIITDPPWGTGESQLYSGRGYDRAGKIYSKKMVGNDQPYDPQWILDFNVPTLLFGANFFPGKLPAESCWICWDKRSSPRPGQQRLPDGDQSDFELAWTNFGGRARMVSHQWFGFVRQAEKMDQRIHPSQKPLGVMRWILDRYTTDDHLIIDPYAGSCSTLRAAKDLDRQCIGIEIDTAMCELAVPRLMQEALPLQMDLYQKIAKAVDVPVEIQEELFP